MRLGGVPRALSIYNDTLDYSVEVSPSVKKTVRITGHLRSGAQQVMMCGSQFVLQRDLQKLALSSDPDDPLMPGSWRGWRRAINPKPSTILERLTACPSARPLTGPDMVMWDATQKKEVHVPLNDIVDYVARLDPIV